jgi:pimeloyl-[acyl-carrier protein] methyl ester esterase
MRIVLLPGLDGTGRLFKRFLATAPAYLSLTALSLPEETSTYEALAGSVVRNLPQGDPLVLIAESFSGPLAVAVAERHPVSALVFCNSFVNAPRSRGLRWLILPALFMVPIPALLMRRYMLGPDADDALIDDVTEVVGSVPATVLASRMRLVLDTDKSSGFARCGAPTLYVRGMEDRLVPDAAWRRMAAIRPITTAHVAGPHLLLQANPVGAWNAIAPFLESLAAV